jgi:hypothetical protein
VPRRECPWHRSDWVKLPQIWVPAGTAQIQIVAGHLAGSSGAGKSRLAERLGLPVRLDDFYKGRRRPHAADDRDRGLRRPGGPGPSLLDALHDDALAALTALSRDLRGRRKPPLMLVRRGLRTPRRLPQPRMSLTDTGRLALGRRFQQP